MEYTQPLIQPVIRNIFFWELIHPHFHTTFQRGIFYTSNENIFICTVCIVYLGSFFIQKYFIFGFFFIRNNLLRIILHINFFLVSFFIRNNLFRIIKKCFYWDYFYEILAWIIYQKKSWI